MGFISLRNQRSGYKEATRIWKLRKVCVTLLAFIATTVLLFSAQSGQEAQAPSADRPAQSTESAQIPSADKPVEAPEDKSDDKKLVGDDPAERQRQLAADKAKLLKLATELKEEMDKGGTDTLSIAVIRKAAQIEKLAHSVKLAMSQELKATR